MEEQIILLRHFILSRPATNAEHQQAQQRLESIVNVYESKIDLLEKKVDKLEEKAEQLETELNGQDDEKE